MKGENNMNELYKEILLNLMLIEDEKDPIVRMLAYAKIGGMVKYALIKEDIEKENAEELMNMLKENIYVCVSLINKHTL